MCGKLHSGVQLSELLRIFHPQADMCTATRADPSSSLLLQDSFRVVTASRDLSLRVLTWRNDSEGGLTLESRYHLLGGSHTMSRSFGTFVSLRLCIVSQLFSC